MSAEQWAWLEALRLEALRKAGEKAKQDRYPTRGTSGSNHPFWAV